MALTTTVGHVNSQQDYAYDASGHPTAISTTGGYSETLGYDSANRLTGAHLVQGTTTMTGSLGYNASGLRTSYAVTTTTGAGTTTYTESFLYRGSQLGSVAVISNRVCLPAPLRIVTCRR